MLMWLHGVHLWLIHMAHAAVLSFPFGLNSSFFYSLRRLNSNLPFDSCTVPIRPVLYTIEVGDLTRNYLVLSSTMPFKSRSYAGPAVLRIARRAMS